MSTIVTKRRTVHGEKQVIRTAISPNPVAPTPIDPPRPAPAAPPDPPWTIGRACYDHGNISEIAPPALDPAALAILIEARGADRLAEDLTGGLAWCDRLIRETLQAVSSPHGRAAAIQRLIRLTADRATYGERLVAVGGTPGAGLAIPMGLVRWGRHSDPVPTIVRQIGAARDQLAGIDRAVEGIKRTAADDGAYHSASVPPGARGPMDVLLATISTHLGRKAEVTEQLRQLEQDRADAIGLVATRVKSAIDAAGGASAITAAVHSALTLAGAMPARPAGLDQVEADLARLEAGGLVDGQAVEDLKTRQAELIAAAETARSTSIRDRRQHAVEVVKSALAGVEAARAEMEDLGRRVPSAFPAGFPAAVEAARFDRAVMAELTSMIAD